MPPLGRVPEIILKSKTAEEMQQEAELRIREERIGAVMVVLTTSTRDQPTLFKRGVKYFTERHESVRVHYQIPGEPGGSTIEAWVAPNRQSEVMQKNGSSQLFTRVGQLIDDEFVPTGKDELRASFTNSYYDHQTLNLEEYYEEGENLNHDGKIQRLQDIEDTLKLIAEAEDLAE